jgi:hypothetical protein
MAWVLVHQAKPGMALAAPGVDRMGRSLIPARAELSERPVGARSARGIEGI